MTDARRRLLPVALALALSAGMACGGTEPGPPDSCSPDEDWGSDPGLDLPGDDVLLPPDDGAPPTDPGPGPDDPGTGPDGDAGGLPADPGPPPDEGPHDPGLPPADTVLEVVEDPGAPDPGVADTGPVVPLPGFGAITGDCGVLDDAEWGSPSPFLFRNAIDFGSLAYDASLLTAAGQEVVADGNLGGSSVESEALAVDLLARCEGAALLKTESEIGYQDAGGKKTDEILRIDGRRVGVSVVRAFLYPLGTPYTAAEAQRVLRKKLGDIPLSAANAVPADAWERSALAVLAFDDAAADLVAAAWEGIEPDVRGSTIVLLTTTRGQDAWAYP